MNRRVFLGTVSGMAAALLHAEKAEAYQDSEPKILGPNRKPPEPPEHFYASVGAEDTQAWCMHEGCHAWVGSGYRGGQGYGFNQPCPIPAEAIDPSEKMYTDFFQMLEDIAEHTRTTGDVIVNADEPHRYLPTLGFWAVPATDGPGVGWSITLQDVAKSFREAETLPDDFVPDTDRHLSRRGKAVILRHYLHTAEGREKLARSFPNQRRSV